MYVGGDSERVISELSLIITILGSQMEQILIVKMKSNSEFSTQKS